MTRMEVTVAGVGGQGSILAGVILGSAAVTYDGKYAVQTQAYSSELRGGFAAAWVIISDQPVIFPRVTRPDVLVAQAQDAIDRFCHTLKPDGILIVDSDMISTPPANVERVLSVPATSIARNRIKAPVTMNMVMLGALCKAQAMVSREALEKAIVNAVPEGKEQVNLQAFHLGFESVGGG
ncbi:MAG: 2-oxoacid:acceptor oxidoreductase family protein [Candidatus Hydrogenedentota bacterium]|nr:MAG: 2-oxoacid:acceptor oxidoreductase family protein [Candidatus Hydrogenedentota bacterium]